MRTTLAICPVLSTAAVSFAEVPAPTGTPDWSVAGTWLDTCNCASPCPCWKSEKPTLKDCRDLFYFHVDKGHWGKTSLDGVDLVAVAMTPPGKSTDQATADKDWVFANFYVSQKLAPDVTAAMQQLFLQHLSLVPPDAAKKHAWKPVDMKASLTAAGARVSIPKILELDVKKTAKPYGTDTSAIAPFSSKSVKGEQTRYDFSDDGQSWKLKGANASFATFDWSAKKEAAAAAAAAQKK
jgi:hypothetical protein